MCYTESANESGSRYKNNGRAYIKLVYNVGNQTHLSVIRE